MKKNTSTKKLLFLALLTIFFSCGSDDSENYQELPEEESPVVINLDEVPYQTLSEYKFYEGELKNMEPAYKVIPYELNSKLFTDYAHKKRFIWMPKEAKATYTADGEILNFPVGAVLIKNFFYENVQPTNSTRIIETRLMIKKTDGWIFANYVWDDSQTEAYLNLDGSFTDISWTQNGETKSTTYRIPSETECHTCHKSDEKPIPIGTKPQNLNKIYAYKDGSINQLSKWIEEGYLEDNIPNTINSTVNYADESQPLELRVRSYLDINCAHCHSEGAHCDYMPMRLAFTETTDPVNMGICVEPYEFIDNSITHIISKNSKSRSAMYYRLNTTEESFRMPMLGRTIVHEEAIEMIEDWINSMDEPCP